MNKGVGKKNIYHGVEEEVHGGHGGNTKEEVKGKREKSKIEEVRLS